MTEKGDTLYIKIDDHYHPVTCGEEKTHCGRDISTRMATDFCKTYKGQTCVHCLRLAKGALARSSDANLRSLLEEGVL